MFGISKEKYNELQDRVETVIAQINELAEAIDPCSGQTDWLNFTKSFAWLKSTTNVFGSIYERLLKLERDKKDARLDVLLEHLGLEIMPQFECLKVVKKGKK